MKAGHCERPAGLDFAGDARLIERALRPQSYPGGLRVALVSLLDRSLYRPQCSGVHGIPPMTTSGTRDDSPSFRRAGIDDRHDARDAIRRKAAKLRMPADQRFVLGVIHAVDLVVGDVAVYPLHARTEARQDSAGLLRDALQLARGELACTGNITLDYEFRHGCL